MPRGAPRRSLRRVANGLLTAAAAACVLAGLSQEADAVLPAQLFEREPLDLNLFEDDDCLEAPYADVLLGLLYEMCDLLEQVVLATSPPRKVEASKEEMSGGEDAVDPELVERKRSDALAAFDIWAQDHVMHMTELAGIVLSRPYCEPGKVSYMAAECLLLLRNDESGEEQCLQCITALDEDMLVQMTPRGKRYETRLHLVLRSPWPALRLLDLLARLYPETGTTRMGACRRNRKWNDDPDKFDWPWFKPLVARVADIVTTDTALLDLRPEDGPLSVQFTSRWLRVHSVTEIREAIIFSDDVFDTYREHHYKAGCHLGVITSYVLQMLLVNLRDIEGRLHRYTASVAQLINLHAPFTYTVRSDWAVFRLLYLMSLLQRRPPKEVWYGSSAEPRAPQNAARELCARVDAALEAMVQIQEQQLTNGELVDGGMPHSPVVFVTAAWGPLAQYAGRVLTRLVSLPGRGKAEDAAADAVAVLFLALDSESAEQCQGARKADETTHSILHCIEAPQRLGIEGVVAKYLSLAAVARLGLTGVWLDLDVFPVVDLTPHVHAALALETLPDVVFAKHLMSESVSPAVVIARGSATATDLLLRYAGWLRENPFLLDHQGWDQFLQNRKGDYAGGFDYQGRNVTVKDDKGPSLSFIPKNGAAPPGVRYAVLGKEMGSGDGWIGPEDGRGLAFFHFWGADEPQADLFDLFYPHPQRGFPQRALSVLRRYRRQPSSAPRVAAILGRQGRQGGGGGRPLHIVSVSYADGCCRQSLKRNRQKALAAGVDEARAYGRKDLSPAWAEQHKEVLSQRRGAGWWLWKPHVILRALKDPAVPWARGVVIWVDAGNHLQADPRPLLEKGLQDSDVTALRLKWCHEVDWTSAVSLRQLNVSSRYAVTNRPQLGAYFLVFRKTPTAISFVEEWLEKSQDPGALIGAKDPKAADEVPGFQKHQADQSVFSVLFKEYGFHALSLEEGHKVVKLARWRE